jgi:hypothetical protein
MATVVALCELGWRAEAALRRTRGAGEVLAVLRGSLYLTVDAERGGTELIWLGAAGAALHGRAVVTAGRLPDVEPGEIVELDARGGRVWRPRPAAFSAATGEPRSCGRALMAALGSSAPRSSFGALMAGVPLAFPLERATAPARALAEACAGDDAEGAAMAAVELLGLGPGLTPAGDDFVGGAFFARAQLATRPREGPTRWAQAAAAVVDAARGRTHPISLALLTDLVGGHGHAPLHELSHALAGRAPLAHTLDTARRVTRIGHSSGWDMLAGFVLGMGEP